MNLGDWKKDAACIDMDTELFFDKYEESVEIRESIESICAECPVRKQCFASAVTNKGWGVHGGIYLEGGKISKEFNRHRTKASWGNTWKNLTIGE